MSKVLIIEDDDVIAQGMARSTGKVAVCLATSGPGAIHLLNGLYDAAMDHQPVLAIVGQSRRTATVLRLLMAPLKSPCL